MAATLNLNCELSADLNRKNRTNGSADARDTFIGKAQVCWRESAFAGMTHRSPANMLRFRGGTRRRLRVREDIYSVRAEAHGPDLCKYESGLGSGMPLEHRLKVPDVYCNGLRHHVTPFFNQPVPLIEDTLYLHRQQMVFCVRHNDTNDPIVAIV